MYDERSNIKCPQCGSYMIWCDEWKNDLVCEDCGYSMDPWEEEDDGDDYSGSKPDICRDCGGPYPACVSNCSINDD